MHQRRGAEVHPRLIPAAPTQAAHALLRRAFEAGVAAVAAEAATVPHLPPPAAGRTLVAAVGKAAPGMARAAHARMGPRVESLVLTRYGHAEGAPPPPGMTVWQAAHPVPDGAGLEASRRILAAAQALGPEDQLLALVSGGGSALLTLPAPGVSLAAVQDLTRALLRSGAAISEMNGVRRHVSAIQGGRLAVAAAPARVTTIVISDVPGDDPALIASGPTIAASGSRAEAAAELRRHSIEAPGEIWAALADPANDCPPADSPGLVDGVVRLAARAQNALDAAAVVLAAAGYRPIQLGDALEGDAAELGAAHAAQARALAAAGQRVALVSGGETTVRVTNPDGRGGRNTAYALGLALALDGAGGVCAGAGTLRTARSTCCSPISCTTAA